MRPQIALLFLATQLVQVLGVPTEATKSLAVSIDAPKDATFKAPNFLAEGQSLSAEQQAVCYICTWPCSSYYCCNGAQCAYIVGLGCVCLV